MVRDFTEIKEILQNLDRSNLNHRMLLTKRPSLKHPEKRRENRFMGWGKPDGGEYRESSSMTRPGRRAWRSVQ